MRESEVRQALRKRIMALGGEERAVAWLGRRNAPDVLALLPGRTKWVETKRPKKEATEAQAREHERMRLAGCDVCVITTLDELDEHLPL